MDIIEYKHTNQGDFIRHPWEQARLRMLAFMMKHVHSKKYIADIGSGDAWMSINMAANNPDSVVIAHDINYDDHILKLIGSNKPANLLLTSNISEVSQFIKGKTDLVVLMDVLEHVENPEAFIREIKTNLSVTDKTNFIVTVPAYQSLFSQHDRNLAHYRRYSRRELISLLERSGLIIEKSGYCFNSLLIPRWFQVQKEKKGKKSDAVEKGIHAWKGGAFMTGLLRNIFWIEFKISWYLSRLGINLPGLTCYCICRHSL